MMRSLFVAAAICTASPAFAIQASPDDSGDARLFLAAITANDAVTAEGYVTKWPLPVVDLWFDNASCHKQFGGTRKAVLQRDFARFVWCLKSLAMHLDESTDTYEMEPGIQVTPTFVNNKLTSLSSTRSLDRGAPTTFGAAMKKQLVKGRYEILPHPADRQDHDKPGAVPALVAAQYCVSTKGTVDWLLMEQGDPTSDYYRSVAEEALRTWVFKPFKRKGKALRVCSRVILRYPQGSGRQSDPPLPPPPAKQDIPLYKEKEGAIAPRPPTKKSSGSGMGDWPQRPQPTGDPCVADPLSRRCSDGTQPPRSPRPDHQ